MKVLKLDTVAEELKIFVENKYEIIMVALLTIAIFAVLKKTINVRKSSEEEEDEIPGGNGLPFVGETFSFLAATNSTKGCYDFVRVRREWYGKWFKTRMFGKIHVFLPTTEAARKVFTNDFGEFNKSYIKSMATLVGPKSVFAVPVDSHKRIRHILSALFSIPSLSKYVPKFDKMLSDRLKQLQQSGQKFSVLDFTMKLTLDSMCELLLSIKDESLLQQILKDCEAVSDGLLSVPLMIPGTTYYKGMKVSSAANMMWSVKYLEENPHVLHKLREEQFNITKHKEEGSLLCLEDLNNMSYGLKVVKESLRMSNVVLWFPRVAQNDCIIDGKFFLSTFIPIKNIICYRYDE